MTEAKAYRLGRWTLVPGETEVTAKEPTKNRRHRFIYRGYSVSSSGDVSLSLFGGQPGKERLRSFRPEQIKTVHRTARLRGRR